MVPRSRKFGENTAVGGRSFRRLSWDDKSPTVAYGHREIHVHPNGKRRLSIYEAILLQGFPKKYWITGNLSQQVEQVSNVVPPPVAKAIAKAIKETIFDDYL
jgi:DNA (cytosine-5)-methyltransferase 1